MKHTYRSRMIVNNTAIFLAIFVFIFICMSQGFLYRDLSSEEKNLAAQGQNAGIYITGSIGAANDLQSRRETLEKKSKAIIAAIENFSGYQTFLLDATGSIIANSENFHRRDYDDLYTRAAKEQKAMAKLTKVNGDQQFLYLSPLVINDQLLGYVGFNSTIASAKQNENTLLLYLLIAALICLPLMIFLTRRYADRFVTPIEDLTAISREINDGNYHVNIIYKHDDELGRLTEAFNDMINNVNKAIDQLDLERNRLAGVLASLDDGLLALDGKGNVITANTYVNTYFNINNPKTIYDFTYQSFLRDIFDDLKNGKQHISMEVDCNDRDLMIIGSPITESAFEENYMIVIRNMTAANRIKKDQAKFISSVSHELRTPLTTIIGYTDMILRRNLSENPMIIRSCETINHEGHRLLRLVDDLLSVNALDQPEFSIKKTNLDCAMLLKDVTEQMRIKGADKNIEILLKIDSDLPEILGDYDRLRQVFINILHNAIKYSNEGDVVDVVATSEPEWNVISIRDYGVGMSEKEQEKIFSAFYRVEEDRARSEGEGGAGLGLYLVRQIITKHEGTVEIASIPGEGTNIIVKLPVIEKMILKGVSDEN